MSKAQSILEAYKKLRGSKYDFKKISQSDYEGLGSDEDYDRTEIDGKDVEYFYKGDNCVAVHYAKANIFTSCPDFNGDVMDYVESDPYWPYGN